MTQGPIQRVARHRIEPRNDARLPTTWIGGSQNPTPWRDGVWLTQNPPNLDNTTQDPVLAFLGRGAEKARANLLACAKAGARVYVLVGPGWGEDAADLQLLQAARVLVRRVPEVPASALQTESEARLWIGGGFALELEDKQASALRHLFLRLFWHEATDEVWSGGPKLAWRAARERPFDVPEAPTSAPIRWEPPDARLAGDARGASLHLAAGLPPNAATRRLWYPVGPEHHEKLAKLAQAGAEVLWSERGLPDIQVHEGGGEILLPGTRGRLRICLTTDQATEVNNLLEDEPVWRFHTNARIGETSHRSSHFWLPGEKAARALEAEQAIKVPDVQAASLRAVPDTAPTSVPAAQPLALSVRYQWTVIPPRAPSDTEEDALVGRWRKLDEEWFARLARVREVLSTIEEERGRIGRAFLRLVSAMLGFKRTHDRLLEQVAELEKQRPSLAGPPQTQALLTQANQLENEARQLQTDQEESERKAREDEEREKQQAAWKSRVEAAERSLPERRASLLAAEERLRAVEDKLQGVDESLKSINQEAAKDVPQKPQSEHQRTANPSKDGGKSKKR
jgi:hypothetical protein